MGFGSRHCLADAEVADCSSYPPRMSQPGEIADVEIQWRWLGSVVLQGAGWLIIAFLGLVVVARIVAWDEWRLFADVDAATEVLFLPAWLVLVGALVGKKWWMAGAAALLCATQVVYVAPEVLASSPIPAAARTEPTIRLFDANVQQDNYSMAGYIEQLRSYRPDVVTLEETLPGDYDQFLSSGVFNHLPYRFSMPDTGSRGFIIASRYPLGHVTVSSVHELAYMIRCSLAFQGRRLPLWVVHTTAPINPDWNNWNLELNGVHSELQKARPRPLLMVGDFNASWGNRGFQAILSTGLTDAAAARGQPFDFTWSQRLPVLPPFIRIDHVLTGGDLTVTTISTHSGPGSGHRDITATVAVGK
jgi:endonuclease/exonuclease/phosphatase (EEP) superfamily protein YafD